MEIKTKFDLGEEAYIISFNGIDQDCMPKIKKCFIQGVSVVKNLKEFVNTIDIKYNILVPFIRNPKDGYQLYITEDKLFKTKKEAIDFLVNKFTSLNNEEDNE